MDLFEINIQTARLTIRKYQPSDLDDALEHRLDDEVSLYTSDPMSREEALEFYEIRSKPWKGNDGEWLNLSVILNSTGKVIGELGFNYFSSKNKVGEFGYRLNPKYQGQGYAYEATRAMVDELFDKNHAHKLIAICDPRNVASYSLMEKLGMKREAHFEKQNFRRGEWVDEYWYGLLNPNHK